MIAYLKGSILKKTDKDLILDTGNIGYRLFTTKKLLSEVSENDELEFFIHSHIREDTFDLYGFQSSEELNFFQKLISVNGIGPKVALEIMSTNANKIKSAIINEDLAFICQIPGIGKKTAQRLILELKEKIEVDDLENLSREHGHIDVSAHEEVIDALNKLGYNKGEILQTLKKLPTKITATEEIITFFLKNN